MQRPPLETTSISEGATFAGVLVPAAQAVALSAAGLVGISLWLAPGEWVRAGLSAVGLGFALVSLGLAVKGHARRASWVLVAGMWCVLTGTLAVEGIGGTGRSGYLAVVIVAALLLGRRGALGLTALCVASIVSFEALRQIELFPLHSVPFSAAWLRASEAIFLLMGGSFLVLAADRIRTALAALRRSEQVLRERNLELEASRDEQDRFRAAVDQAGEAIVVANFAGDIFYANPAFYEVMQTSPEEAQSIGATGLAAQSDDGALIAEIRDHVKSGRVWQRRYASTWSDGSQHFRFATVAPVRDRTDRVVHFVGVFRDITEAVQQEEQALQNQKLESLGVMAGGIAHDFNNLLTAILGNASLLVSSLPATAPARESAEEIVDASEAAGELTAQLLAYAGGTLGPVEALDVSETIRSWAGLIETAASHQVRLHLELAPGLPLARAERSQLQQVVLNLVTNAAEACVDGKGEILVRSGVTQLGEMDLDKLLLIRSETLPQARYVFIEVRDNGCGIDPADRIRMLDPFYTTKSVGRGLGLAVVARAAKAFGGALLLDSIPGSGSVFRVLIPTAAESSTAASDAADPARPLA